MDAHTLMLQFQKESFQADIYVSSNLPATVEKVETEIMSMSFFILTDWFISKINLWFC